MNTFLQRVEERTGVLFNEEQMAAIHHEEGPALVLACPGSGKTTTMITRLARLIEERHVAPQRLLAISFSKAAALALGEKFTQFFPHLPKPQFATIHRLAFHITRHYFAKYEVAYQLIESNQAPITKQQLLKKSYEMVMRLSATDDVVQELETHITLLKNKMVPIERWKEVEGPFERAGDIAYQYEQLKRQSSPRLIDFDDMLEIGEQALREDAQIRQHYASLYDFIATDESQDTSLVQFKLIEHLLVHHQNVFVVADDDQSIYMWRGASPTYLLQFERHYPNASFYHLQYNYRSATSIIERANRLIQHNQKRYEKEMNAVRETEGDIRVIAYETETFQTNAIVDQLVEVENFDMYAILFRNNKSAIPYIMELHKRGIPFQLKDEQGFFFNHWIVKDLFHFFALSEDRTNVEAFGKIAFKLQLYLSRVMLNNLKGRTVPHSVFDTFIEVNDLRANQKESLQMIDETLDEFPKQTIAECIRTIRQTFRYEEAIVQRAEKFGYRLETMIQILDEMEQLGESCQTVEQFREKIDELQRAVKEAKHKGNTPRVTLSTIHSAKGLEWDTVFLIDASDGILPSERDVEDAEMLEEARRLFYVGMTRAKNTCLISYPKRTEDRERARSSFLEECFEFEDATKRHVTISTRPKVAKRKARPQVNEHGMTKLEQFAIQKRVEHRVFGEGIIIELTARDVKIRFEKETKQFDLQTVMTYGFLTERE